ncbi:MAG: hypothetical protein ABI690_04175 [Chloroflexota bacterium]
MDLPGNSLDAWIEGALQPGTSVSPQQKQIAWERLSQKAMEQVMLPAQLLVEEKPYAIRLWEATSVLWRLFSAFAVEEERYERARQNRHMMRYQYIGVNGELAIQFLAPLRFSV